MASNTCTDLKQLTAKHVINLKLAYGLLGEKRSIPEWWKYVGGDEYDYAQAGRAKPGEEGAVFGWITKTGEVDHGPWYHQHWHLQGLPDYTASVDSALSLLEHSLLEDKVFGMNRVNGRYIIQLGDTEVTSKSLALGICQAVIEELKL